MTACELEEFKAKKPIDEVVAKPVENQANGVTEVQQGGPSDVQVNYGKDTQDVPPPQEPPMPSRYNNILPSFRPEPGNRKPPIESGVFDFLFALGLAAFRPIPSSCASQQPCAVRRSSLTASAYGAR